MSIPRSWLQPPREFSVMPFWFWNDALDEARDRPADRRHGGARGLRLRHPPARRPAARPRLDVGAPAALLRRGHRRGAAAQHDASCSTMKACTRPGLPPARWSRPIPRSAAAAWPQLDLPDGDRARPGRPTRTWSRSCAATNGRRIAVIDRPADSVIRGLHYVGEGPAEDEPPAADILNPAAVAEFIHLVYDGFAARFGRHFGDDDPGHLHR